MNSWAFTGNLGQDCKVEQTQNGATVCKFSVGVSSGFGDNKKTTWANCLLFGKLAQSNLPAYLTTGQKVAVTGELTLEQWQNSQGEQKSAVKVVVSNVELIGSQNNGQQSGQAHQGQQYAQQQRPVRQNQAQQRQVQPSQSAPQPAQMGCDEFDNDPIPFANPYQFIYNVL